MWKRMLVGIALGLTVNCHTVKAGDDTDAQISLLLDRVKELASEVDALKEDMRTKVDALNAKIDQTAATATLEEVNGYGNARCPGDKLLLRADCPGGANASMNGNGAACGPGQPVHLICK